MVSTTSRVWLFSNPFSVSPSRLSSSASYPPFGVTRLGPSKRVPGTTGVFCTCLIKKFTPLKILPDALRSMPSQRISQLAPFLERATVESLSSSPKVSPEAAPYVENLVRAPRKAVSLRRFLALRAAFSSDNHLYAATDGGWYLLLPSKAVGLRDVEGLTAWLRRHHPREKSQIPPVEVPNDGYYGKQSVAGLHQPVAMVRRSKAAELHRMEQASMLNEEPHAGEVSAGLAEGQTGENEEDAEELHEDGTESSSLERKPSLGRRGKSELARDAAASDGDAFMPSHNIPPRRRKQVVQYITEEHFFQINDGVQWELPPRDDLAQPGYWKQHRSRMALYRDDATSLGGLKRDEFIEIALRGLRTPPAESMIDPTVEPISSKAAVTKMQEQQQYISHLLSERQVLAHGEKLFQVLTQKANVSLKVDDETSLVTLVPIVTLQPGDELLLHYGWEWWTQRLLSMLLLAVEDSEISTIRWIESLCRSEDETDVFEPFPKLVPMQKTCKGGIKVNSKQQTTADSCQREAAEKGSPSLSTEEIEDKKSVHATVFSKYVLYNQGTRREATDAAVLMFAIRRSCQDHDFFRLLMLGGDDGTPPVFNQEACDVEVPIKAIRRVLLQALMCSSHGVAPGATGHVMPRPPEVAEEDEGRFSV